MAQIDKLTIKVESNGLGAAKALAKITDQLKLMNKAVSEGGMLKIVHQTERLGNATATATKKTHHFLASIIRIAKYRMLRTTLKELTQAFREGIGNLYQYSAAMNSTDSAMNKNTMDSYASSLLYLKNSAGAAAAPLLQMLLPVVQQLVDWFVAGANAVNQFISALQGKSTFTRAVYTMTEFGDQTARAGAAAKELKKTVLGFDELNLLQVDNPSGGGGGASTPDYSKMFEEAEISDTWKKIGDTVRPILEFIGDHFELVLGLVGAIGLAMKGWKIPEGVVSFFKDHKQLLGGIALTIGGATIQWEAAQDIQKNGLDLKNGVTSLLGGIATAAGMKLVLGTLGVSGPWGWAIGAAVAVVTEIVALKAAYNEKLRTDFYNTELGQEFIALQKEIDENAVINVDLKAKVDSLSNEIDPDTLYKLDKAKELINDIFTMDESDNKTQTEINRIKEKINELAALGLPGVLLSFNDETGHINETREAIEGVTEALLEQYRVEANKDALIEAYGLQQEAGVNLKKNYKTQQRAQQDLTTAANKYNTALERNKQIDLELGEIRELMSDADHQGAEEIYWLTQRYNTLTEESWRNTETMKEQKATMAECSATVKSANAELENSIAVYEEATGKVNDYEEVMYELTGDYSENKKEAHDLGINTDELRGSIETTTTAIQQFKDENFSGTIATLKSNIVNTKTATDAFGNSINQFGQRFSEATGKVTGFGTTVKYVDGQLVDSNGNVIKLHDSMQKLIEYRATHMGSEEAITNAKNRVAELSREFQNMTKDYKVTFSADITKLVDMRMELEKARDAAYKLAGYKPAMSAGQRNKMNELVLSAAYEINMGTMKAYASGGFPESGSMFLAGEGGSPEMVGTINGKTAVANSDQIVQAVSSGVYSAMMAAMNGSNGRNNEIHVTLQLGEYELANAVVSALNNQTRRIGYSQLEGV